MENKSISCDGWIYTFVTKISHVRLQTGDAHIDKSVIDNHLVNGAFLDARV